MQVVYYHICQPSNYHCWWRLTESFLQVLQNSSGKTTQVAQEQKSSTRAPFSPVKKMKSPRVEVLGLTETNSRVLKTVWNLPGSFSECWRCYLATNHSETVQEISDCWLLIHALMEWWLQKALWKKNSAVYLFFISGGWKVHGCSLTGQNASICCRSLYDLSLSFWIWILWLNECHCGWMQSFEMLMSLQTYTPN